MEQTQRQRMEGVERVARAEVEVVLWDAVAVVVEPGAATGVVAAVSVVIVAVAHCYLFGLPGESVLALSTVQT